VPKVCDFIFLQLEWLIDAEWTFKQFFLDQMDNCERPPHKKLKKKKITKTKQMKEYATPRETKSSTTLQLSTTSSAEWGWLRAKYKKGTNME
jgi:hypothetical protein